MAEKITLYNEALGHLGERKLANLAENRESRRALDDVWDTSKAYCLEQGIWNWAIRSVEIESSTSITPTFGFSKAFQKPDDWARTAQVSANENFEPPLQRFIDEAGYWWADCDPLYVRFVSNDTEYGNNLARWTTLFSDYVSLRMAVKACFRITGSDSRLEGLLKLEKRALSEARSKDAMAEPPGRMPTGSWVMSRGGGSGDRSRWNGAFS